MRTKTFNLTITTALAAALGACSNTGPSGDWDDGYTQYADRDTAVCVDPKTKQRIPDDRCSRSHGGSGAMWYYLGRNSSIPYHGETIRGGSYNRPVGAKVYYAPKTTASTKSVAISRGGFGSSARSSGFSASS